jgi:hypothetical protein
MGRIRVTAESLGFLSPGAGSIAIGRIKGVAGNRTCGYNILGAEKRND